MPDDAPVTSAVVSDCGSLSKVARTMHCNHAVRAQSMDSRPVAAHSGLPLHWSMKYVNGCVDSFSSRANGLSSA